MQTEGRYDALGASYHLVERRGQGATGEVWRAVDRRTGETVAAKLLRPEHVADPEVVGRFVRERSILVGLRHPAIVAVRDLVVEGDRLAIVMDFVAGGSLREVLRRERTLPPAQALDVVAVVLDALAAAHAQRVLHRDVKPDNVLLAESWRDAAPGAIRLTDFGIARMLAERRGPTTGLLGTPQYMSPELLTTGDCGTPADVYGAGVLLYELLAGRTPFAGPGTDYTVAHRHVTSDPPRLPVPDPLWERLAAMLAKDPAGRPTAAQAAASLRALRGALDGLPALPAQEGPAEFASARGPATLVRGIATASPSAEEDHVDEVGTATGPLVGEHLDLGAPGPETLVRPLQRRRPDREDRLESAPPARPRSRRAWRDPRVLGAVVGAALLVLAAVLFATREHPAGTPPDAPPAGPVRATQQDPPTPTGLTVERSATYDAATGTIELTLTYAAQNAPLAGPFLEVIPGSGDGCPTVEWADAPQRQNLPSVTGVTTPCAWSVDPGRVAEQQSVAVTARVAMPLSGSDTTSALQEWLDGAAAATSAALGDPQLSSTAYAAQRMQGIDVVAPSRTVSQKTLPLTLYPIWPSGRDQLNPIYRSPAVGKPSSLLTAIAGGEDGVEFSDGCSGGLAVSADGLVVTALSVAPECHVNARVGNFTDLSSNSFAIVTRGG